MTRVIISELSVAILLAGCMTKSNSDGGIDAASDILVSDTKGQIPGIWKAISAGTFQMGSPSSEKCRNNNETRHQVTLSNKFEIQTRETSQDQFSSLMGYNPSSFSSCNGTCPVEQINWHEAVAYCNALSKKAGFTACYTCTSSGTSVICQEASAYNGQRIYTCPGYRLPTEAEWEYAYRSGTSTAYYSGENDGNLCSLCRKQDPNADIIGWYCHNSINTTHPAGQKKGNAWDLYDMAGNVWEWCHDWYQSNLGSLAVRDPWGSTSGAYRVYRGGSWGYNPVGMRAAYRRCIAPAYRSRDLGFRCARTIVP
jgi:formylglycine-generating enzyme required for sulfatase activity